MDPLIHTGQLAPAFTLSALDGRIYRLEEGRGRIIVLNFWSAECPWAERGDQELLPICLAGGSALPCGRLHLTPTKRPT